MSKRKIAKRTSKLRTRIALSDCGVRGGIRSAAGGAAFCAKRADNSKESVAKFNPAFSYAGTM